MLNPSENREKLLQSLIAAKRKTGPTIVLSERGRGGNCSFHSFPREGYDLLFEKRSPDIVQGGEICFPGGKRGGRGVAAGGGRAGDQRGASPSGNQALQSSALST